MSGDPLLAVAYVRVSTEDQALGPEAQRGAIARWASGQGVTVVAVCEDLGVSGGAPLDKRPGLLRAMRELDMHRAGVLVVAKRDRLARDVVIAAAVESLARGKGARILSADGTSASDGPEGMLMRGIVDLFAQYERAVIRSRTTSALAVKRDRGERIGMLPIGFGVDDSGKLLARDELEQKALDAMFGMRDSGYSIREIAAWLDVNGPPPRGKRWHPTTVARLLARRSAGLNAVSANLPAPTTDRQSLADHDHEDAAQVLRGTGELL